MPFVETISWFLFSGLLGWAALSDGRTLTIPNRLSLAVALLYVTRLPVIGAEAWLVGLGLGLSGLLLGFVAFERGVIGGGDAKLIAAVLPWAGLENAAGMLLVTALAGGVLATGLLLRHRGPFLMRMVTGRGPFPGPADRASPELPYGIAIACGGWWLAGLAMFGS